MASTTMEPAEQENAALGGIIHDLSSTNLKDKSPADAQAAAHAVDDWVAAQVEANRDEDEEDPIKASEKRVHRSYMKEALSMAQMALDGNETPVGCIIVYRGRIIAKGMNATNVTRNGTRHAELMAISALLSYTPENDKEGADGEGKGKGKGEGKSKGLATELSPESRGDADVADGHIYPHGQKLHPAPRISKDVLRECILYVTVEPCVMCASLLRQYGIRKVYFGAVNDKFGGTGGVFRIHKNSEHVSLLPPIPLPRPVPPRRRERQPAVADVEGLGSGTENNATLPEPKPPSTIAIAEGTVPDAREGDGGNIESGYDVEGGWGRDEAVTLLRKFYVQENGRAPQPRKKEGRAARLAAMMEKEGITADGVAIPRVVNTTHANGTSSAPEPASPCDEPDLADLSPPMSAVSTSTPDLPGTAVAAGASKAEITPPLEEPIAVSAAASATGPVGIADGKYASSDAYTTGAAKPGWGKPRPTVVKCDKKTGGTESKTTNGTWGKRAKGAAGKGTWGRKGKAVNGRPSSAGASSAGGSSAGEQKA